MQLLAPLQALGQPTGLLCVPQPLPAPELGAGTKHRDAERTEGLARLAEPSVGRGRSWAQTARSKAQPQLWRMAWCREGNPQ